MDNKEPDVIRPLSVREGFNFAAGLGASAVLGAGSLTLFSLNMMPVLATVLAVGSAGIWVDTYSRIFKPKPKTPKP